MDRNLFRRVETCYPILDADIKETLISDLLLLLEDNCQSWQLLPDGSYERRTATNGQQNISAQQILLSKLANN
jgi:polyphosphate kinase